MAGALGTICIHFLFSISVVARDAHGEALFQGYLDDDLQTRIDSFNCSDCCIEIPGVSNQVGICEVYKDKAVVIIKALDERVCQFVRAHLRFFTV